MKPYDYTYFILDDIINEYANDYFYLYFGDHVRFDFTELEPDQLPYCVLRTKCSNQSECEFAYSDGDWLETTYNVCREKLFQKKNHFIEHCWEPIWYDLDKIFWEDCARRRLNRKVNQIIIHSEKNSKDIEILKNQNVKTVHWFAHAYLCSELYFKHYEKLKMVTDYKARPIKHPWLCTNRLIRKHRTDFLELLNLDSGCYSFLNPDPNGIVYTGSVPAKSFDQHTNDSAEINVKDLTPWNTSFLHIVTETVWQDKIHFTEKIFKPIVLHQPFVVLQAPGSLEYLRSYGFRTFGDWWDESYDSIQDPNERMKAIADIVNWIPSQDLNKMRNEMSGILEHNFRHFYDNIPDIVLDELRVNLQTVV